MKHLLIMRSQEGVKHYKMRQVSNIGATIHQNDQDKYLIRYSIALFQSRTTWFQPLDDFESIYVAAILLNCPT
jgi:hypothetical protein